MPEDFVQIAPDSTGSKIHTISRVIGANTVEQQVVLIGDRREVLFRGRSSTFRIVGRAAATQNLMTIYNASTTRLVDVKRVMFDAYGTAARVITVPPAIVRISRFTTASSNGTVLSQTSLDTAETSDVNVTCRGDSSADGTNSTTTLTVTIPAGTILAQELIPRQLWNSGTVAATMTWSEVADRMVFLEGSADVTLRQNQGLVVHLASPAATSIPNTDNFLVSIDWEEYTVP